jgi:hypothetical protein
MVHVVPVSNTDNAAESRSTKREISSLTGLNEIGWQGSARKRLEPRVDAKQFDLSGDRLNGIGSGTVVEHTYVVGEF